MFFLSLSEGVTVALAGLELRSASHCLPGVKIKGVPWFLLYSVITNQN